MKLVSIVTPCYNEEANVEELYLRVREVMQTEQYRYEHIFIDNASNDRTVAILKQLASADPNIRLIVNARNFGHIRSPIHALFQARGDAIIGMVADLQDPPEMIPEMLRGWEEGNSMVLAIKQTSEENSLMSWMRRRYYRLVSWFSSIETFENFSGYGLFERRLVDLVKSLNDPYPYFRGIIAETGLPHKKIYYRQPGRKRGITKNNFYTLYDMGILGIINHSKVPLRIIVFSGFASAVVSMLIGLSYALYKLFYWKSFSLGVAPLVIGSFFMFSVILLFLGVIGEYVGAIHTQIQKHPLVVERERVNFEALLPTIARHQPALAEYLPSAMDTVPLSGGIEDHSIHKQPTHQNGVRP